MPCKILFTSVAHKQFKKLNPSIRHQIKPHIQHLADHPQAGSKLKGELSHLRSQHLNFAKNQYRVAYKHEVEKEEVTIYALGKRMNLKASS